MSAPDPARSQPKASSPTATAQSLSHPGSYLSFSRAETLTPESSAGGRPSRASAVDTVSPESRPGLDALLTERFNGVGKVSVQNSSTDTLSEIADTTTRPLPCVGRNAGRLRLGELRRRKYTAVGGGRLQSPLCGSESGVLRVKLGAVPETLQAEVQGALAGHSAAAAATVAFAHAGGSGSEPNDCEVLIEGPLQQRLLLVFWRWRWCVLDRRELRVYRDEEASLLLPEKPLERHSVVTLSVGPDLHFPSVLICANARTGEPVMFLRAGPGLRWEEVAASTLWLSAFATAGRPSCARQRSEGPPAVPEDH